jgi:ribonucleoside-diphosphate reductase alpha chain
MPSNYFPSLYQEMIHLSRYSRWLPEENRRETWVETVDRYFNFFDEHLRENNKFNLDKSTRDELREAVLNLEIMPSMRCLMTAGEALKRENVAGYNCLAAETNILTKEYGQVKIGSIVGKKVSVLNSDGQWSETVVETFGQQNLMKVDFSYTGYNGKETVYATPNHDWIVDDKRIQTKNLKSGMKIPFVLKQRLPVYNDIDYKLGIIHGLIYGDGTRTKYKRGGNSVFVSCERTKGYMIRLCSDQKDILPYFDGYPVSYPKSYNGDPVIYLYDNFAKTHVLKELPSETETESYMIGFFRGWLAADGSVGKKQVSICVGSEEETWLRKIMPKYGIYFSGSYILPSQTNFGIRKKDSRNLKIWNYSLTKDDFIIERKRNNFIPCKMERTVVKAQSTNRTEEVFCVNVPIYHNFVIERGILTGNCSYVAVDNTRAFDEILYILMNGTGVGFSVESKFTEQLPIVSEEFHDTDTTILVADSKLGWAKSLKELIHLLYAGQVPRWDVLKVRPAGAPLKTFGGRASGPDPLVSLFKFCVNTFKKAAGRRLTTLECHDIVCKIAEIVVVGGVRRSALISLSDLSDDRMRMAKSGEWWKDNVHRALANNSFVAKEEIDVGIFMKEWLSLYESRSGERGIFSRTASQKQAEKFERRNPNHDFGTNPCSEIILRSREFCNLTEVVVREIDTPETLQRKIKLATILGTIQSTLTNFKYISKKWKENCEEERLLGVSLTGITDNGYTNGKMGNIHQILETLKETAVKTNKEWSNKIGIPQSAAITCVKPSGTVSALVDSASGIHARHAPYYIRTVRSDKKDPLAKMMVDLGFPVEDDVTKPDHTYVFSFPMKGPENAIYRKDMSAIEQLELWLTYQRHWCEHKPSVTVTVKEEEWPEVGAWVWNHFGEMSGVSFLPYSDHVYQQAPFQDCTKEEYEALLVKMPKNIDWTKLAEYEKTDTTVASQELACSAAGGCEII